MGKEKFSQRDLDQALDDLAMLRYFPSDTRASVMHLLAKICPHREALEWLVGELVNHVGEWPGPAEVRGLLCTRYDAADGIDGWCNLPGYRAEDYESRHLAEHDQRKTQERIGGSVSEWYGRVNAQLAKADAEAKKLPPGREAGGASASGRATQKPKQEVN